METNYPYFWLDRDIVLKNIQSMASKARISGTLFRPHFKTHQSKAVGQWFRNEGVTAITVSSVKMAKYFASDGWDDITVAFPFVHADMEIVDELAGEINLGILVENIETIEFLSNNLTHPVRVWIKIDVGYHRTGIDYADSALVYDLVRRIKKKSPLLNLIGFLTHAGHSYHAKSRKEISAIYFDSADRLNALKQKMGSGYEDLLISYGDTPSCSVIENFSGVDEIRPGNFVFYDLMQLRLGSCTFDQIAGIVICPVVAKHRVRFQIVILGGAIHFSKDFGVDDGKPFFGLLAKVNDKGWQKIGVQCYLISLSQEHGILQLTPELFDEITIGDFVGIVPVHSCLTANELGFYKTTSGEIIDHMSKR